MKKSDMYAESMLKGRMAETLVEEMLKKCGNQVYRFGYESVLQNLTQLESKFDTHTELSERMRAIPDFIVLDGAGKPAFVEVKFRRDPIEPLHEETIEKLESVEMYWNAEMIFVNCVEAPFFRIARPPYFKNVSQPKRGLNLEPITSVKQWNIDEKTYKEYEQLVEKYLTPTLINDKK
jgi:hypothetical protein